MPSIVQQLVSNGFIWEDPAIQSFGLALPSLRGGLRSYFESHRSQPNAYKDYPDTGRQLSWNFLYTPAYCENFTSTILGLHHFFRLIICYASAQLLCLLAIH